MQEPVYRTLELLCAVVAARPIGTNLGLLHLLWMLVSGRLLTTRGALFPGLGEAGLTPEESRRAWAALGQGRWRSAELIAAWTRVVEREGQWQAAEYGGYRPVAIDVTGFWRPRLCGAARLSTTARRPAGRCRRSRSGWWSGSGGWRSSGSGCRWRWSGPTRPTRARGHTCAG